MVNLPVFSERFRADIKSIWHIDIINPENMQANMNYWVVTGAAKPRFWATDDKNKN